MPATDDSGVVSYVELAVDGGAWATYAYAPDVVGLWLSGTPGIYASDGTHTIRAR